MVNDDRRGLAWMVVLHQGSGSPRRGTVRFHSLEAWLFRRRGGRLLAHTRQHGGLRRGRGELPRRAAAARNRRLLPRPGCRSAYERWDTALNVGGALRGRPGFAIHNPITQFDPSDPARIVFNKRSSCGPGDRGGWTSRCKGDRRSVLDPRWRVSNRGPAHFNADARGRRAPTGLAQFVSRRFRVDQSRERGGVENAFVMERPSDGGIFRSGRGFRSAGFEHPGLCILRSN